MDYTLPALLIGLLGCVAGAALVFIDQIAIFLYSATLKKYLIQNENRYAKSFRIVLSVLLAAFFYIAAFFVIALPAAAILLLIRRIFAQPEPLLSASVRSLLMFSPLLGMALGVILRKKTKCKSWGE